MLDKKTFHKRKENLSILQAKTNVRVKSLKCFVKARWGYFYLDFYKIVLNIENSRKYL